MQRATHGLGQARDTDVIDHIIALVPPCRFAEVQSRCGYPLPVSSRIVETRDSLLTPLDAPERSLAFPEREITVNVTRAAQHARLRLTIPALVGLRGRK